MGTKKLTKALRICAASLALAAGGSASAAGWWQSGTEWNAVTWDGNSEWYWVASWGDVAFTFSDSYSTTTQLRIGNTGNTANPAVNPVVSFTADEDAHGLSIADGLYVGENKDQGILRINKGTYSAPLLSVANGANVPASIEIEGGYLEISGQVILGDGANSVSTNFVNGGALVNRNWFCVGRAAGAKAYLEVNGGCVSNLVSGTDCNFTIATLGDSSSVSELKIKSGEVYAGNNLYIGEFDSATLSMDDGRVIVLGAVKMGVTDGFIDGETATLEVNGGTLTTSQIVKGNAAGGTFSLTLDGGTLVAASAGEFISSGITMSVGAKGGTIDVGANNVTIAATVTGSGTIYKKGSGTLEFTGDMSGFTGSIVVLEGGAVTASATGTSAAVGVGTALNNLVFTSTAYAWTGAANDGGLWSTPGNWSVAGATANECPNSSSAVVTFPNDATINLSGNYAVSSLVLGGSLTLSGNSTYGLTGLASIVGGGALILDNSGIENANSTDLDFSNDVVIQGNTKNWLTGVGNGTTGRVIKMRGNMSGSGYVEMTNRGGWYSGVQLFGDNKDFCGTAKVFSSMVKVGNYTLPRGTSTFQSASSGSANAHWQIGDFTQQSPFAFTSGTIEFGTFDSENNFNLPANSAITIKVGAASVEGENFEFDGVVSRGANSAALNVIKVGKGTMNFTGKIASDRSGGVLTIQEGIVTLSRNEQQVQGIILAGGTLEIDPSVTYDYSSLINNSPDYTASLSIKDASTNYQLSTSFTSAKTAGLTKKGEGTLTLTTSPSYTGKTTIEAGTLSIPAGTALGELSIAEGAYLHVDGADGDIVSITSFADGDTTKARIKASAGSTINFVYDDATSKWIGTITRADLTYTWNGSCDSSWGNIDNWTVTETDSGDAITLDSVNITGADTVVFPADGAPWRIALTSDQTVKSLQFKGNTTLSGALIGCATATADKGILITLGDSAGFKDTGSDLTIGFNLEISASENAPAKLYCADASNSARKITLATTCAITGTGYLLFDTAIDHYGNPAFEVKADMSDFYGYVTVDKANAGAANRDNTKLWSSTSGANSHWTISNSLRNNGGDVRFFAEDETYKFGFISGNVSHNGQNNYRLQIGALGLADNIGGNFFNNQTLTSSIKTEGGTIEKIGSGTATFYGTVVHAFEIASGTLLLTANGSLQTFWNSNGKVTGSREVEENEYYPSITFTGNSTLALGDAVTVDPSDKITVNSGVAFGIATDTARSFASSIGYEGAAFTKKGSGALTLSNQSVALAISVEDGSVVVPATSGCTAAKGTKRTVSGDKYVFEKAAIDVGDTTQTVTAADQAAADAIAAQYVVTPTAAQRDAGVTADYYKVVAKETETAGTYALEVKFADEVAPEVSEETVNGNTVKFVVSNFKKGLYYGVATGASADAVSAGTLTQCEDETQGVELSADLPASGVQYYQIVVSDTATAQ